MDLFAIWFFVHAHTASQSNACLCYMTAAQLYMAKFEVLIVPLSRPKKLIHKKRDSKAKKPKIKQKVPLVCHVRRSTSMSSLASTATTASLQSNSRV